MTPDTPTIATRFAGPWPLVPDLIRRELAGYLDAAAPDVRALPTRCEPWTVRDLTAHLAATFRRFSEQLARGRRGEFDPPFPPEDISRVNLEAVAAFGDDPFVALPEAVETFLGSVTDEAEAMPHQFGVIPAGLQMRFGLSELALHRDDLEGARGSSYRPDDDIVDALISVWEVALMLADPDQRDPWLRILHGSGRGPTGSER